MKRIQIRKEDIKAYLRQRKERRQEILEKRRNSVFAKKMAPIYKWMNRFSLLLHFLWAFLLNFVMEAISRHSIGSAWEYFVKSPWTFLFNTYIIFITFLVVYLFKRRVFTRILLTVLWLAIGITNGYMLSVRVTPFNAQDLKVLGDALTMIDKYFTGFQGVMLLIGILAVIVWVISMWRRGGQYTGKIYRIPTLIIIIAAFGTIGMVTNFAVDKRVVSNYFGNIAFAYEDYGLPYCFSASLFDTGIDQPSGYSEKTIRELVNDGELLEESAGREELPNIILIQLESFFDTDEAEFFTTSKDPIPTFHHLMKNYSSGYFKVPSVGAGTANTEFEVLTGMGLRYFGPGEYPYKTTAKYHPMESVATALKSLGYGAHALHNNGGMFYSRADVFEQMGFDSYTSKEFMNVLQYTENGWAKDDILTEHILNAMDSTEQQDFVFTISVEGHGDYDEVLENPEIEVYGIEDETKTNQWEYYVNHLHETDKFIADLIAELDKRGEPSVLILYGDHLPTMGLEAEDLKSRYLFNTNYAIWDNIGLEKKDRNIPTYQIVAEVFERLDIHSGTVFNYHQHYRKTKGYMAGLEMLQYDMIAKSGKKYVYGGKENAPTIDGTFRMGIKDVTLFGMDAKENGNHVFYGENMTANSKIYINGDRKKTFFYSDARIELRGEQLHEGDIIVVGQLGAANRIFRTTEEYAFQQGQLVLASEYVPPVPESVDGEAEQVEPEQSVESEEPDM